MSKMIDGPQTLGELRKSSSVSEDLLRRRRQNEALKAKHMKHHLANKKKQAKEHKTTFQSAEHFVQEYRQQDNSRSRFKRVSKQQKRRAQQKAKSGDAPSTASSSAAAGAPTATRKRKRGAKAAASGSGSSDSLLLVVRVRSTQGVAKEVAAYFTRLRLHSINSAVFIRNSGATAAYLEIIKPYVVYGTPSKRVVRDLIFKRGFARLGVSDSRRKSHRHTTLSNNAIVEAELGDVGIICLDDIVHEICTVGDQFERVNRFLMCVAAALSETRRRASERAPASRPASTLDHARSPRTLRPPRPNPGRSTSPRPRPRSRSAFSTSTERAGRAASATTSTRSSARRFEAPRAGASASLPC